MPSLSNQCTYIKQKRGKNVFSLAPICDKFLMSIGEVSAQLLYKMNYNNEDLKDLHTEDYKR